MTGRALLLVVLLAGLPLASCSPRRGEAERSAASSGTGHPVVVVGVDGLEWDVLLPLLETGRLPHLAALMARGSYGELATLVPTYSPVIWTTIATGKGHEKHGIHHFARSLPGGDLELFDNADRTTKALWNIASDFGKRVWVVGWWMTYPVEPVHGVMVAQTNTLEQVDTRGGRNVWKGALREGLPGQVHPPELEDQMMSILAETDERLPELTAEIFGELPSSLSPLARRLWENCQWAFRADATYLHIVLELLETRSVPDLSLLYFGGPDVVGHRFWRYMEPELYEHRPPSPEVESLGNVIEDDYVFIDRAIGRLVEAYGEEVDLFVLSDHGMHPVNLHARFDPDDPPADINSGDHQDAPAGVLIAAGPSIRRTGLPDRLRREELEVVGNVLDVAPTLLTMMGIPLGRDMDGWPMTRLFREELRPALAPSEIASHDSEEFLEGRKRLSVSRSEEERLEQLRSLGYLDGGGEER